MTPPKKQTKQAIRIRRIYTRVVVGFLIGTALLILLIAYLAFAKTTITITPATETLEATAAVIVRPEAAVAGSTEENVVAGEIISAEVTHETRYTDLETSRVEDAKATGTVTITNNYSKPQPLVETTRLQSSDGLLFRTQETVVAPAGGSVDVPVIADAAGTTYEIGPSHFTIPGLWKGLQDTIFGDSVEAITGGQRSVTIVRETDIAAAQDAATAATRTDAERALAAIVADRAPTLAVLDESQLFTVTSEEVSTVPGDETDAIVVTQTATLQGILTNEDVLYEAASNALLASIPANRTLESIDPVSFNYAVRFVADDESSAELRVTIAGAVRIDLSDAHLSADRFTNKRAADIRSILDATDGIASYTVTFSPFWTFRSSSLPENISIIIAD